MPELPPPPGVATPFDPWRALLAWRAWVHARLGSAGAIAGGVLALIVVIGVGWTAFVGTGPSPPPELSLPRAAASADPASAGGAADDTKSRGPSSTREGASPSASEDVVVVHVAGAVARPGLYRLASEARVADAIDAAGGLAADADPDGVNLAAKIADAERVYLPRRGEVPPGGPVATGASASAMPATPIDLNTATVTELDGLPGVGPATAAAIVDYRKEHGRFRSVDELLEVRGIGDAKLAAIRSKVRVR